MLKSIDAKRKTVVEGKEHFSEIIQEVNETDESIWILNQDESEAVIRNYEAYEEIVKKYRKMEEELFLSELNNCVESGPRGLISAGNAINEV